MKKIITSTLAILALTFSWAQGPTYNMPESIKTNQIHLIFQKVKSTATTYSINYKIENTGHGILVIERNKTSLMQESGEIFASKQTTVLKPGKNKTIYNQFRAKSPAKAASDIFYLKMGGIFYAKKANKSIEAEKFVLAEKAIHKMGNFQAKVMEYNVYSDRVFAEIKCSYNGPHDMIGNIDLSKIKLEGGQPDIVKKGDVVFSGKSYTFAINIKPSAETFTLDWAGVLSEMKLKELPLGELTITSTDYVAPVDSAVDSTAVVVVEEVKPENCELSYADFSALKKDIETEMNGGGKPVEMANEFLIEKKCISTVQVVDLMGIFNLDGQRLSFAKMAYKYTSDKQKFHLAVAKLSYTKNKQALEEFLEQQ